MILKYKNRIIALVLIILLTVVFFSGCMNIQAEDLYALPHLSEGYIKLQQKINEILNQGAELSPPIGGINRQAVQMRDLNGTGVDEVIAFFSVPSNGTLNVYIFKVENDDYAVAEIIELKGTSFDSIRYVDMDGDGTMEIVIGVRIESALNQMEIFSIKDFHSISLTRSEYIEFFDFDITGNGNNDVIVLKSLPNEAGAAIAAYLLMPDGELVMTTARLSGGIEVVSRVLAGKLIDNTPAVFTDSEGRFSDGNRLITDVFIIRDNELVNITVKGSSGISEETIRSRLFIEDITGDGIIKVPIPRAVKAQSLTQYYVIDWYTFSKNGYSTLALTTYHNNNDEWFLIIPFDWRGKVSIRREDDVAGERTVVFSYIQENNEILDFLKIYKITGDLREERAGLPGRKIIIIEGSAVYAFELLEPSNSFGLSFDESLIRESFNLMYAE